MAVPTISAPAYHRVTLATLWSLAFIVVTGATVRLTGSGLGCPDWPTCTETRLVAPFEYHAMVEFVNRTVTGLVSVAVMLAVLGSLVRVPRRRDLVWLSLGLVAGVIGQIVLGGLTVLFELAPPLVMGHFILSMVLLANATVLHHVASPGGAPTPPSSPGRGPYPAGAVPASPGGAPTPPSSPGRGPYPAGAVPASPGGAPTPPSSPGRGPYPGSAHQKGSLVRLSWLLVVAAGVVIVTGTVVTGAGPHGGDEHVRRLDVFLPDAARAHGIAVVVLLALTLVVLWRVQRDGAPAIVRRRGEVLLTVLVAQAAIGYTQYFTGVPVLLVAAHVAGAVAVWVGVVWFVLGVATVSEPPREPAPMMPRRAERIAT